MTRQYLNYKINLFKRAHRSTPSKKKYVHSEQTSLQRVAKRTNTLNIKALLFILRWLMGFMSGELTIMQRRANTMYVCMYVFMYLCMYACTYVCMYVCMYVQMGISSFD